MLPHFTSCRSYSSCFLGLILFFIRYAPLFNAATVILALYPTQTLAQVQDRTRNFTIPLDSSEIIYTPFRCDRATSVTTPDQCSGGWSTGRVGGNASVSTVGPNSTAGEVIPQMFFQFRGSALYLITTEASNARTNITVTTNETTISAVFDTTLGSASILNLVASTVTTFALTFLPSNDTTEFELTSLILTVPNGTLTTTLPVLPSMTLPPSSSLPIFTPTPTTTSALPPNPPLPVSTSRPSPSSSSDSSSAHRSNVAIAVGLTLGLGLGLTSVTAISYWWYKKRRPLRTRRARSSMAASDQNWNGNFNGGRRSGRASNASRADARATENFGGIEVGRFTGSRPGAAGAGGTPMSGQDEGEDGAGGGGGGGGAGDGHSPRLVTSTWRNAHS